MDLFILHKKKSKILTIYIVVIKYSTNDGEEPGRGDRQFKQDRTTFFFKQTGHKKKKVLPDRKGHVPPLPFSISFPPRNFSLSPVVIVYHVDSCVCVFHARTSIAGNGTGWKARVGYIHPPIGDVHICNPRLLIPGDRASRERMVVIVALYILFSSRVLVDIYHELLQMDVEWIEGEEVQIKDTYIQRGRERDMHGI